MSSATPTTTGEKKAARRALRAVIGVRSYNLFIRGARRAGNEYIVDTLAAAAVDLHADLAQTQADARKAALMRSQATSSTTDGVPQFGYAKTE
ncbi:MAG: hypothetical protein WBZ11_09425 [Candidatus Sulfotelmatobacter sp.]